MLSTVYWQLGLPNLLSASKSTHTLWLVTVSLYPPHPQWIMKWYLAALKNQWLIDCLVGWLVGWLIDRSIDRLIACLLLACFLLACAWNSLPDAIYRSPSLAVFKHSLKTHLYFSVFINIVLITFSLRTVDIVNCRLTDYELLRWLVETPSRDFAHYRLSGGRRIFTTCHELTSWHVDIMSRA